MPCGKEQRRSCVQKQKQRQNLHKKIPDDHRLKKEGWKEASGAGRFLYSRIEFEKRGSKPRMIQMKPCTVHRPFNCDRKIVIFSPLQSPPFHSFHHLATVSYPSQSTDDCSRCDKESSGGNRSMENTRGIVSVGKQESSFIKAFISRPFLLFLLKRMENPVVQTSRHYRSRHTTPVALGGRRNLVRFFIPADQTFKAAAEDERQQRASTSKSTSKLIALKACEKRTPSPQQTLRMDSRNAKRVSRR